MGKTRVYYNSACPVCNAGITSQRGRMQACGISDVEWVDVHTHPEAVQEVGAPLEAVRERLYLRDPHGRLAIGAEALAELFAETPNQRWLGRLLRLPLLRALARGGYNLFARGLYRWNRANKRW
jgi:predicted DCC family thiol-disulfide oxidoreductase YuxK